MNKLSIVDFVNNYNRKIIDGANDYNKKPGAPINWTTVLLDQGFVLVRLPEECQSLRSLEAHKWCCETFGYTHFLRTGIRKFFFEEPKHATMFALKWL